MKKILFTVLIATTVFVGFARAQTNSNNQTATQAISELKVGVKGMVCAFCAQGIEKKFMSQPEVSKVEVSLENKYVKLKFKEGKVLAKEKITEILKDAGYEATFGE